MLFMGKVAYLNLIAHLMGGPPGLVLNEKDGHSII